jgi:arsenate reductase (glutaredoxin)
MPTITIYHNGRCGKSRKALELLDQSGLEYTVVQYLLEPPTEKQIAGFAAQVNGGIRSMVRVKEPFFKELFDGRNPEEGELIRALYDHPSLMERPLVVVDGQPLIVRSEEALERLKGLL